MHGNRWRALALRVHLCFCCFPFVSATHRKCLRWQILPIHQVWPSKQWTWVNLVSKIFSICYLSVFSNTTIRVTSYWSMVVKPAYSKILWTQRFREPFDMFLSLCAFSLVPLVQGCVVSTLGQLEILWVVGPRIWENLSIFPCFCQSAVTQWPLVLPHVPDFDVNNRSK